MVDRTATRSPNGLEDEEGEGELSCVALLWQSSCVVLILRSLLNLDLAIRGVNGRDTSGNSD